MSRIGAARVARLLAGRAAADGPLHQQLSDGLAELIHAGEIPAGTRLPSERALAPAMRVSRTTVTTAYTTLGVCGLVDRRQGSGTYVLGAADGAQRAGGTATDDRLEAFTSSTSQQVIDLSSAAMPGLDLVAEVAASTATRSLQPWLGHHGYRPGGLPELRAAIADHLTATAVPTGAEQVLVTSGAQQAMQVVAGGLARRGDVVIVEDPTYRGALTMMTAAGIHLCSVPSGADGVDVDALEAAIARTQARFAFLLPVVHNPTGSVLPEERRLQIAQLARRQGTTLVEDVAAAETIHHGPLQRPIASYDTGADVVTIGSLSKLFWGGLRIGWIRASAVTIARLTRVKGITDLGSGVPSQLLALDLLPHATTARAQRRRALVEQHQSLSAALARQLPSWRQQPPRGGGSLWIRLPGGYAGRFADAALRAGVRISPGTLFSAHDRFDDHVRLPFVADTAVLEAAVRRLGRAWDRFSEDGPPVTPDTRAG